MKDFVDSCIESHPELLKNKVCFIQVTDGYEGYDIELECSLGDIAGLYPTDTWEMTDILSLCDHLTAELQSRSIRVIEDREEWDLVAGDNYV